jgi:hypothetical protein
MQKAYIYWLHLSEHTDMKSEGYIGVAKNHHKRFESHKREALKSNHENPHLQQAFQKYGDRIQKHIVWLGEENVCYENEEILRPKPGIGWNINKGGDKPPIGKGFGPKKESLEKLKRSWQKKMINGYVSPNREHMKGKVSWNRGTTGIMKPNKTSFQNGNIPWNKGVKNANS